MLLLLVAGALMVASCGSSENGQAQPGSGEAETSSTTEPTTTPPSSTPPLATGLPSPTASLPLPPPPGAGGQATVPATLLDQVRADAAQRAGVDAADVQIVGSTAQTWSDGSLGCPKPGEAYIQVLVDGFQIFAQAGGRTYDYRTSQSGIRLCEK